MGTLTVALGPAPPDSMPFDVLNCTVLLTLLAERLVDLITVDSLNAVERQNASVILSVAVGADATAPKHLFDHVDEAEILRQLANDEPLCRGVEMVEVDRGRFTLAAHLAPDDNLHVPNKRLPIDSTLLFGGHLSFLGVREFVARCGDEWRENA